MNSLRGFAEHSMGGQAYGIEWLALGMREWETRINEERRDNRDTECRRRRNTLPTYHGMVRQAHTGWGVVVVVGVEYNV